MPTVSTPGPDNPATNPFWPKSSPVGDYQEGATDKIDFGAIQFGTDVADVTVNVVTVPAGQAWSVNWGDGSAVDNVAAGTNLMLHHYADKSAGKSYIIAITSSTDTDTKRVTY